MFSFNTHLCTLLKSGRLGAAPSGLGKVSKASQLRAPKAGHLRTPPPQASHLRTCAPKVRRLPPIQAAEASSCRCKVSMIAQTPSKDREGPGERPERRGAEPHHLDCLASFPFLHTNCLSFPHTRAGLLGFRNMFLLVWASRGKLEGTPTRWGPFRSLGKTGTAPRPLPVRAKGPHMADAHSALATGALLA